MHEVELLHQEPVVRRQVDLLVKPPVRPAQARRIVSQRLIGGQHVAQDRDFFRRGVAGGKARRQPLQRAAHDVKLRHLRVVEGRHDQRPPVAGQKTLGFQPLQRLAHRRAADTQPVGQFAFHQPVAGFVDVAVDRLEDQRIGVLLRCRAVLHGGPSLWRIP